jgi:predicted transcriptional regulator
VRGFGDLEAVLMDRVWEHAEPVTVRELHDELSAERYSPSASREEYSARLMREALADGGDTEMVLSHFLAQIDGEESEALRSVLSKLRGGRSA